MKLINDLVFKKMVIRIENEFQKRMERIVNSVLRFLCVSLIGSLFILFYFVFK